MGFLAWTAIGAVLSFVMGRVVLPRRDANHGNAEKLSLGLVIMLLAGGVGGGLDGHMLLDASVSGRAYSAQASLPAHAQRVYVVGTTADVGACTVQEWAVCTRTPNELSGLQVEVGDRTLSLLDESYETKGWSSLGAAEDAGVGLRPGDAIVVYGDLDDEVLDAQLVFQGDEAGARVVVLSWALPSLLAALLSIALVFYLLFAIWSARRKDSASS